MDRCYHAVVVGGELHKNWLPLPGVSEITGIHHDHRHGRWIVVIMLLVTVVVNFTITAYHCPVSLQTLVFNTMKDMGDGSLLSCC